MSTATTETSPSGPVISLEDILFDYPEADIIIRSRNSYQFRVLKLYIVHSSPIFEEKLLVSPNPQPDTTASATLSESDVKGITANALSKVRLPVYFHLP
jgi:hypothetical protein